MHVQQHLCMHLQQHLCMHLQQHDPSSHHCDYPPEMPCTPVHTTLSMFYLYLVQHSCHVPSPVRHIVNYVHVTFPSPRANMHALRAAPGVQLHSVPNHSLGFTPTTYPSNLPIKLHANKRRSRPLYTLRSRSRAGAVHSRLSGGISPPATHSLSNWRGQR